jgi:hypothetical protein
MGAQEIRLRDVPTHVKNFVHDQLDEHWQLVVGTLRAALTSHVHRQDETKPPENRGGFFVGRLRNPGREIWEAGSGEATW